MRWIAANGVLLKSAETQAALRRTLASPKLAALLQRGDYVATLLRLLEAAALVDPVVPVQACRDADDDKFLSLAVSGRRFRGGHRL